MASRRSILSEYDARAGSLEKLGLRLRNLLEELLLEAGLNVHSVTYRLKERGSLERKVQRRRGRYQALHEVHDVLGLRVITYFSDDVDAVAEVVEREFAIDQTNSEDKRELIGADRFGYLSVHYVATLSQARCALTEYKRFIGIPFEVQIRSILQHAWAEIEHDLGYKTAEAIPQQMRRQFSQLAGMLENADGSFARIRHELAEYAAGVAETIKASPTTVGIDRDSVASLIDTPLVREIDLLIAAVDETTLTELDASDPARRARELRSVGFRTIDEVERVLSASKDRIRQLAEALAAEAKELGADDPEIGYPPGVSLLYACYVQLAETTGPEGIAAFLEENDYGVFFSYSQDAQNMMNVLSS